MAQVVGSLLITGEARMGPFSQSLAQSARDSRRHTGVIRRDLNATSASMTRLGTTSRTQMGGRGLLIAARNMDTAASRSGLLRTSVLALTGVMGGLTTALAANAVMSLADSYTSLTNQLKTVIDDERTLVAVEQQLFQVANRTRSGIKETSTLFTRLTRSTKGLNLNYRELIDLTETIQKGFVVGGATPSESASAALQFTQALQSNRLGGEELRTLMETPLGGQLARGMGIQVGEFRKLSKEGKLTTEVLVKALKAAADEIDATFGKTVPTIAQSFVVMDNALTQYVGSQDAAGGTSAMLSKGIIALAENIDTVADVLLALTVIMTTRFAAGALGGLITRTAMASKGMAMMRKETLLSARSSLQAAVATKALAAAELQQAQTAFQAARAGSALGASRAAAAANLTRATAQMAVANRAAMASTIGLNAAIAASTRTAVVGAAAMRAFTGVIAFLGGPVGAALTVAGLGLTYLATRTTEVDSVSQQYAETVSKLIGVEFKLANATGEAAKSLRAEHAEIVKSSREQLLNTRARLENTKAILSQIVAISDWTSMINPLERPANELMKAYLRELGAGIDEVDKRLEALQTRATSGNPFTQQSDVGSPDLVKQESAEAEKLRESMERLRREALLAGPEFSALNREVASFAAGAGIADDAIIAYTNSILAGTEASEQFKEIESLIMQKQAWSAYNDILKKTAPTVSMIAAEQNKLNFLVQAGAITADQAALSFADFLTSFQDHKWIDQTADAFAQFSISVADDFDSIEDHFSNLLKNIAKMVQEDLVGGTIRNLIRGGVSSFIGGSAGGGLTFGSLFHEGGQVGSTSKGRVVPSSTFNNAPRYHNGLRSNEMAAILEKGEQVLTGRDQNAVSALAGEAGRSGNTYHIDARGSTMSEADFRRVLDERDRQMQNNFGVIASERRSRGAPI